MLTDGVKAINIAESGVSLAKIDSVKIGSMDLGNNLDDLDFSSVSEKLFGEKEIIVKGKDADGKNYRIEVPVLIITKNIDSAEALREIVEYSESNLGKYGYYRLTQDITYAYSASYGANITQDLGVYGFKGVVDGKDSSGNVHTIEYDSVSWSNGIFGMIGVGGTIKNVKFSGKYSGNQAPFIAATVIGATFENVQFDISGGREQIAGMNGLITKCMSCGSTFKNVTINIPETCAANLQKGGFFAVQNNDGKFYDVTVNAPGTTILYLLGSGSKGQYATTENVVVDAEEVKYIYDSVTSKQGVIAPRVVTLTGNQDILMTDETYSLNLGDEQTGLTVTSIVCDGENLGTDLSNLDLSAFKSDYAKHGEKTIVVKGVKGDSKIKINVPVTFVTKMIGTVEDLRDITQNPTDSTTKSVFGYYKLSENLDCTAAPDWAGFSNSNPNGFSWANANNGFRGTLD